MPLPQWREIIETTAKFRQAKNPHVRYNVDEIDRLMGLWNERHPRKLLETKSSFQERKIDYMVELFKANENFYALDPQPIPPEAQSQANKFPSQESIKASQRNDSSGS